MKSAPPALAPADADARRAITPVIVYQETTLPRPDLGLYAQLRQGAREVGEEIVPPREARTFHVPAGHFFRITCIEGPQVGDLNLFNSRDLTERFFSGKTRALHGTHVVEGDQLWSCLPFLRPMATVVGDSLAWYGTDLHGGRVHDVIGTRCDPYTHHLLSGGDTYHHCCHSNLTRALIGIGIEPDRAEFLTHDVLNVFMCTGFTADTGKYFMKASPVRPGDYLEFFAEIDLLGVLSACPGGDCSTGHSSDSAACYPIQVTTFAPSDLTGWSSPAVSSYDRSHGLKPKDGHASRLETNAKSTKARGA